MADASAGDLVGPIETDRGAAVLELVERREATGEGPLVDLLRGNGISDEEYREFVRGDILDDAYRDHFETAVVVSPAAQRRVAQIFIAPVSGTPVPQVRARHVLISPDPSLQDQAEATDEQWAAAEAEAEEVEGCSATDADWNAIADEHIPGDHVGIHVHNDTDNGVANSLAAVRAGARQIQGTLNGLGERCGNANLTSIIPTLLLKADYAERYETGVTPERLRTLTHASRILDELLNRAPNRNAPYVGESAFAHKGGIHVSAVQKDPRTYEHVPPDSVGNRRRLLVSDQGGRSNILAELDRIGIPVPKDDPRVSRLLDEVKEREAKGYAYEAADASFELLARRMLGNVPQFFDVDSFRVMVERRHNADGDLVTVSEATVKVRLDGETMLSVGEGNGPVNALDTALRKDLGRYQSYISDLELVDYKVRILTGGTDAVTRVLIESRDGEGNRWFTVGVSPNIVDASFEALLNSINYKLIRDGATAP